MDRARCLRAQPSIPHAHLTEVWIDFDGTLTTGDVVDTLIRRFSVNDDWRRIEADWEAGKIGSRACLARQFALVNVAEHELNVLLDSVLLDPGAADFFSLLNHYEVPVTIVSDGIDWMIDRIFAANGVNPPRVRSNSAAREDQSLRLICPFSSGCCAVGAAHCKCSSIESLESGRKQRVYIGDGRSDLCAARKADVRFAKNYLAAQLEKERLPFIPFETLHDVLNILSASWREPDRMAA